MAEPSERDLEIAKKCADRIRYRIKEALDKIGLGHIEVSDNKMTEWVAWHVKDARDEGRREERWTCRMRAEHAVALRREEEAGYAKGLSDGRREERERCAKIAGARVMNTSDLSASVIASTIAAEIRNA